MFSYAELSAFLQRARGCVPIFALRDWTGGAGLILRHDIDLDIAPAHQLARLEEGLGVRSTFFVMTTAHTYNPASPLNRAMLREMAGAGFEIGLHFDPAVYGAAPHDALAEALRCEAGWLAAVCGQEVRSVSLHNPSVLNRYPLFEGWRNAYEPSIFGPEVYLSDTRMRFRTDPGEFLARARERAVQLLLHPLHYSEAGAGYPQPMVDYLLRAAGHVEDIFSVNTVFRERLGGGLVQWLAQAAAAGGAEACRQVARP